MEGLEDRRLLAATLSIADAMLLEGNAGSAQMLFTVTRDGDLSQSIDVEYFTADGTATAGVDYEAAAGTLTIPANEASATIAVPIMGDAMGEDDESFSISLRLAGAARFDAQQVVDVGAIKYAAKSADINGDGKPDLLVSDENGGVSILLNTTAPGSDIATFAPKVDVLTGPSPLALAVGDLNGDGRPDVVVANTGDHTLSILINTTPANAPVASFTASQTFVAPSSPSGLALNDFNNDGKLDIAVSGFENNVVKLFLNNTAAGSELAALSDGPSLTVGSAPEAVVVGDFNGDGKPDMAAANYGAGTVSILLNTSTSATPTFAAKQDLSVGSQPLAIVAGDLNGDGTLDLAVANFGTDTVSLLINRTAPGGALSFDPVQNIDVGGDPQSLALADLNADGKLDLAVVNSSENTAWVLENRTASGAALDFVQVQSLVVGDGPTSLTIANFNSDAVPDLAVSGFLSGELAVLFNQTPTLARAQAAGTIANDDIIITAQFDAPEQGIRENGGQLIATVVLSEASAFDITVPIVVSGTATQGQDYTLSTLPLFFPAGVTSATLSIDVADDLLAEDDETLILTLGEPTNAQAEGQTVQTIYIGNDDQVITGSAGDDLFQIRLFAGGTEVLILQNPNTPSAATYIIDLTSTTNLTIAGGAGQDQLTVDFAFGDMVSAMNLFFDGQEGSDQLAIAGTSAADAVTFQPGMVLFNASPVYIVNAETLALDSTGSTIRVGAVNVEGGAHLDISPGLGKTLDVDALSIAEGSVLDLNTSPMIVRNPALLSTLNGWIGNARHGGLWDGWGLTSAAAGGTRGLAILLNQRTGGTFYNTFAGASVGATDILIKFTHEGDTDLNGILDASDYLRISRGLARGDTGYVNGDFDFDDVVTLADLGLIDRAFLASKGGPGPAGAVFNPRTTIQAATKAKNAAHKAAQKKAAQKKLAQKKAAKAKAAKRAALGR